MITVFKIFEENNDGILRYSIPEKEFKSHGYELEKLYAKNYKVYTKKINKIPIWCWVAGKTIEIKDYHQNTNTIVNYYLENINREDKLMNKYMLSNVKDYKDNEDYLNIKFNDETNEVINIIDLMKKYSFGQNNTDDYFNSPEMIREDWRSIILMRNTWDDIIDELVFLTEGKIKENPNYKNWEINKSSNKFNL